MWELKTTICLHHPFVFQGILSLAVNGSKRFVQPLPLFEVCVCANPSDPDAELKWGDWYNEEQFCSKQVSIYHCIFPLQTYPCASRALQLQTPGHQTTCLCPSQTLPVLCLGFPARLHACFCWDISPVCWIKEKKDQGEMSFLPAGLSSTDCSGYTAW